ncbi:deleted in malignant brain tumors 1 protein isoform X2 [Lingula anatina]|uniref:Deleted in malignant brain tumors 1 protein isoform X2 n=1 Tax=Lingula anatina TaxID=7574 RepID=A0A1S3JS17_LINAN|nr:deleted in malignant brain tumors 1 protein isoform X2 [Lingula anatina]|eukprot:XP_013413117.1 deleted in malignant brain tumors 1 protein isoform X2 [Lingula anatina]
MRTPTLRKSAIAPEAQDPFGCPTSTAPALKRVCTTVLPQGGATSALHVTQETTTMLGSSAKHVVLQHFGQIVVFQFASDGVLRLINTSNAYEGRLEIFLAGRWGRVCDYGWRLTSADVACKQLGFTGAHTPVVNTSPRGTGFFWIQNIDCQGSETSLADCSHDGVGEINSRFCVETSSNDAGVLCKGPNDGEVRLTGGNQYQGRVEIFYAGSWGIVCKVYWYTYEGQVLCRQLGFSGALQSWSDFVSRTGPRVMLDEIYCDGTESRLDNCSHGVIGYPNSFGCTGAYPHEIRAWCEAPDDGQLRLLDGNGYNSGRVEIKFAGEWRRVCDDGWGINDTAVVCRQLGYSGYVRSVRSWTPKGSGFFWLFKTGCLGTESNLTDCRYGRVGAIYSRSCDSNSYNDAGVYCQGYLPGVIPTSTTTRTTTTTVTSGPTCYSCSGTSGTSCSTSVTCSYGYVCHTTASAYESYNLFYSSSTIAYSYSRGCRSQSLCTSQELQGNTCTGTGTSKVCRQCCTSNFCNSGTLDTSQTSTNNKGFATGSAWFNVLCVLLLIVFAMN